MNANELREIQAPIKDRYRESPAAALITLSAEGELADGVACSVSTGKALVAAGLHPASGGTGTLACSGDMLLQALVACAGVTISAVATALEIDLRGGRLKAEGELDFRGTLGIDKAAPVGFKSIRLKVELDTDASEDRIAKLMQLSERYCVVYQTLVAGVPVAVEHCLAD
ncbi:MAG: OsmC family protein [Rhodocyclaceae bacterium]|nr:OsmC family protein [Rhodocyclaceae bacterium]